MRGTDLPIAARTARTAWVFGYVAAGLAVAGMWSAQTVIELGVMRSGLWLALGFAALGLGCGLLSLSHPAGRLAVVAAAALAVLAGAVLYLVPLPVAAS